MVLCDANSNYMTLAPATQISRGSLLPRKFRASLNFLRYKHTPPVFFGDPNTLPTPHRLGASTHSAYATDPAIPGHSTSANVGSISNVGSSLNVGSSPNGSISNAGSGIPNSLHSINYAQPNQKKRKTYFGEVASMVVTLSLAYLALDNYTSRVQIEKLNQETTAINLKTIQLQQQSFAKAFKQQDLKMLSERDDIARRCFRMAIHIAMLRKQLLDLGVEPQNVSDVFEEFEKNAKVNNSIQNLSAQAIWLADSSEYKALLPEYKQYDKRDK